MRYLHLNPLRAGLVKSLRGLDVFSWSGHAVILGNREAPWQDIGYVLQQFGDTSVRAAICHFAVTRMGISLATVARFPGVSPPAVKQAMERGKDKVEGLEVKVERLVDKFI